MRRRPKAVQQLRAEPCIPRRIKGLRLERRECIHRFEHNVRKAKEKAKNRGSSWTKKRTTLSS
jgi:hypothetical protein